MTNPSKAPTPKVPTIVIKVGEQEILTPVWENPEGGKVDLGQPDSSGNQVTWTVTPHGIIDLGHNLAGPDKPGGTTAMATAVGLGSCTVVATATSGLVSAEMHINVVSEGPVKGEIKAQDV
jgi:hypothetical protein